MVTKPQLQAGSTPVPDPTILTTQQLYREIESSREFVEVKIENVFTKLAEMEKAIVLLQTRTDKTPEFVREQVMHLKELNAAIIEGSVTELGGKINSLGDVTAQQFKSISDQFAEKDKAVSVGLSTQTQSAAATQASNMEATKKMEDNFTILLRQSADVLSEVRRNYDQQISGIREFQNILASRLDRGEGRTTDPQMITALSDIKGLISSRDNTAGGAAGKQQQIAFIFAAIAAVVSVAVVAVSVMAFAFGGKNFAPQQQAAASDQRRSDANDLMLGRLLEQNTQMIQRLQQQQQQK